MGFTIRSPPAPDAGRTPDTDPAAIRDDCRRDACNVCDTRLDVTGPTTITSVPGHVRAFLGRTFRLWRCPRCRVIHCLDVVDLDHYYSKYPFVSARLDFFWRIFYINLARRFKSHGLARDSKLLDYGCGNGLFGQALRERRILIRT